MIQHNKIHWSRILIVLILVVALCATFSTVFASEPSAADEPEETMTILGMAPEEGEKGEGDAAEGEVLTVGAAPAEDAEKVADPETGDIIGIEEEPEGEDEWTCKVCSTANFGGTKCSKCSASRPTVTLSIIALVALAIVIAIGFIKKVNLGFLAIGAAFILSMVAGIGPKYVTKAFDADMFVTLVGVTFLFGMASQNGTLDLFSKKVVALVGKHTVLIPILMFFLSAFISAIGPGHIAAGILMTTFAVYLAFEMKINPITTALFAKLGANAGCASPLSLTGQLGLKLTNNLTADVTNADIVDRLGFNGLHFFLATLVSGFIFTLLLYIFTKSYKVKADNPLKFKDIPKFNWKQWCTIGAIVMMVVLCIGFQMNTGLTAFVMAAILVLLGCADEKKAIKGIPWGTLVFICGVGVLVSVIDMMGGIDMISSLLQKLMTKNTATPVLAATSGILSWVSSTTGVVMPAMFKMLPNIMRNFGTSVNYMEMISAITATSFAAAISPLSTGGAIIMSSYSASKETTNAELNKIFKFLFLLSVGNVLLNVVLSAIRLFGFYGIFG